jgi:hypothetical protein
MSFICMHCRCFRKPRPVRPTFGAAWRLCARPVRRGRRSSYKVYKWPTAPWKKELKSNPRHGDGRSQLCKVRRKRTRTRSRRPAMHAEPATNERSDATGCNRTVRLAVPINEIAATSQRPNLRRVKQASKDEVQPMRSMTMKLTVSCSGPPLSDSWIGTSFNEVA